MSKITVKNEEEKRAFLRTADVYQTESDDDISEYSETLLSIVATFDNAGCPEGFNACSMVGKSKREEVALQLFAVIDPERELIVDVGFKTRGCLAMAACASVVCSMIKGQIFQKALSISPNDIKLALDGVPPNKTHTLYFAVEGVRALIGDFLLRSGSSLEELDRRVTCDAMSVGCLISEHCSLRDIRTDILFMSLDVDD